MKQKDVALIILIAAISGVLSFVVSNFLFATPQNRQQVVAVVHPINTQFISPNSTIFNSQSIDPAQIVTVQNNNNTAPFNGSNP